MLTELKSDSVLEKYKFCEEGRVWKQTQTQKKPMEQILTDNQINQILEKAKTLAINTCQQLGIEFSDEDFYPNLSLIQSKAKSNGKEEAKKNSKIYHIIIQS